MRFLTPLLSLFIVFAFALPTAAKEITLFHTSDVSGLASNYLYDVRLPYLMTSDFVKEQGESLNIEDFGVSRTSVYFHARGQYLWGNNFGVRELKAFLETQPKPVKTETITVIVSNDSLLIPDTATDIAKQLRAFIQTQPRYARQTRTVTAALETYADGTHRLTVEPNPNSPVIMASNPLLWEMILGFDMQFTQSKKTRQLRLIGKAQGEGSRRAQLIEDIKTPQSILVDSGNLLEGLSSVLTDHLSLQRINSLKMAKKMGYFAINVGKKELQGGLLNLLREQRDFELPLISATLKQKGQYLFEPYKIWQQGQHKIAFVGLTGYQDMQSLQRLGIVSKETEILKPRVALEQVIKNLQQTEKPDVVVLLAHLPPEEIQAIENYNHDVHLVLANTDAPLQHLKESLVTGLKSTPRAFVPKSSSYSVNEIHVTLDPQELSLTSEMHPIYFDLPPDEDLLPAILNVRQESYKDALDILIPNLGPTLRQDPELLDLFLNSESTQASRERLSGYRDVSDAAFLQIYQPYMTRELLHHLEMNLLMERFKAEVVIFKKGSQNSLSIPGAMPRLLVYERLKLNDTLNTYYLSGTQLDALRQLSDVPLVFGGFNTAKGTVWGEPLGGQKTIYRTLIPSGASALESVQKVIGDAKPIQGSEIYLRNVLLEELDKISKRSEAQVKQEFARLMKPLWNERRTLFTLGIDDLQLNVSGYNAYNNAAYTEVRETRVISPSSFNFGARARAYSGVENRWLGWTNAVQAKFEGLSVVETTETESKERFTENQDDLQFSSELEFRSLKFSLWNAQLPLTPFLEGIYDTEFTATLNADTQMQNPLQSELRGVLGLSIPAGPRLKTFKTGLALRRDFNVPNNLEGGVDLKLVHEQPINAGLTWNNDVDFRYFFPSPNDNASSLGLTAQWVSSVRMALTESLSLRFFADTYVFQGKLPGTSQLGASVILGVGLGYDRLWKPYYEPLF